MSTTKEVKEANNKRSALLDEVRAAIARQQQAAPGMPAVGIPLDKIFTFQIDGEKRAVIPMQEVLYLVDEILRA